MIEFINLEKIQKNFLNGKISQFVDAYIRKNKVWTPEQMHFDFNIEIESQINNKVYVQEEKYMRLATAETLDILEKKLTALKWLRTEKGRNLALNRFNKKYLKHKSIAERKSPVQERIRFGFKKIENKYFDINFGLKDSYQYQKKPMTLKNLLFCLGQLST